MKRSQRLHLLRAACAIVVDGDPLILGSQAILGTYDDESLPEAAVASIEADIAFVDDPENEKSDQEDAAIGEDSAFHAMYGYYAQGVNIEVAVLPAGWRERLVILRDPASGATGHCLEPHDLSIAKLVAAREKDHEFVAALIGADLLSLDTLRDRARYLALPAHSRRVLEWLGHF